jgi:hypothetical protein
MRTAMLIRLSSLNTSTKEELTFIYVSKENMELATTA